MLKAGERRQQLRYSMVCSIAIIGLLVLGIILFFIFGLFSSGLSSHHAIDYPPKESLPTVADKKKIVEETFRFAWDGYYKIAFPHDELKPASDEPGFSRNDWGATAVDALGTAILMEQADVVSIVMEHVQKIDFSRTRESISVFETTIRYMGGMLSAYDLLTGPFKHLVTNQTMVEGLLVQSERLGDILSRAFIDGHVLPHPRLTPNAESVEDASNSLAGAGTLVRDNSYLNGLILTNVLIGARMESTFRSAPEPEVRELISGGRRLPSETKA
jgi:mannosyl-oligosaccharide alpha-1,2-mannosidase